MSKVVALKCALCGRTFAQEAGVKTCPHC
ncbi:hypothetical protein, partial [Aminobacterium mobile]